jgi:plasmid stability protein
MATLTVRNLPDSTRDAIRVAAARHGRSMEAEVRVALESTFKPEKPALTVEERLARIDAAVLKAYAGKRPDWTVDEFIAERREAAERGE